MGPVKLDQKYLVSEKKQFHGYFAILICYNRFSLQDFESYYDF